MYRTAVLTSLLGRLIKFDEAWHGHSLTQAFGLSQLLTATVSAAATHAAAYSKSSGSAAAAGGYTNGSSSMSTSSIQTGGSSSSSSSVVGGTKWRGATDMEAYLPKDAVKHHEGPLLRKGMVRGHTSYTASYLSIELHLDCSLLQQGIELSHVAYALGSAV
jgi:hypothetical protein